MIFSLKALQLHDVLLEATWGAVVVVPPLRRGVPPACVKRSALKEERGCLVGGSFLSSPGAAVSKHGDGASKSEFRRPEFTKIHALTVMCMKRT